MAAETATAQRALIPAAEPDALLEQASRDLQVWSARAVSVLTVLDPDYPSNLRAAHDRPLALFTQGALTAADNRAIAVIGSRRAESPAIARTRELARRLSEVGYTVVSGLAAGIDTAAHTSTLEAGGRTVAVIGTGLFHAYPPQNADLQQTIAGRGAVVSQFVPDCGPRREHFPLRNGTMAGLARASVITDASYRSGARIQARLSLAQGRPVFLASELLDQDWARELAQRPGVTAFAEAGQILDRLDQLHAPGPLTS